MKRIIPPTGAGSAHGQAPYGEWEKRRPLLSAHLCDLTYTDPPGKRKPGTLSIRTRLGLWCGTLRDPDSKNMLTAEAHDPEALLDALESLLMLEDAPWQPDPFAEEKPKPRR